MECSSKVPKGDNTNLPVRAAPQSSKSSTTGDYNTDLPVRAAPQSSTPKGDNTTLPTRAAPQSSTTRRTDIPIPQDTPSCSFSKQATTYPTDDMVDETSQASPTSALQFSSIACKTSGNSNSRSSLSDRETEDDDNAPITRKVLRDIITAEIGSALKNLTLEQRQLGEIVNNFQQAIISFNGKFEDLKATLDDKSDKIDKLEKENLVLRESVLHLTQRINSSEQHARASNIEIQCVPENKSENLVSSILHLSQEIKCDVSDADITHCTRVAKKNPDSIRPRSILVKFCNPRKRDSFLAAALKYNRTHPKNRLNSRHLGSTLDKQQPVYVVEQLSPEIKSLHAATRARAKLLGYKFVWVRSGRIFIKKAEETDRILIDSVDKLDSLQ